jgi:hypothetical protein
VSHFIAARILNDMPITTFNFILVVFLSYPASTFAQLCGAFKIQFAQVVTRKILFKQLLGALLH